jgi:PAS domain S-box-containing protein
MMVLLIVAVAVAAARGGVGHGMITAALAVVLGIAASVATRESISAANALEHISFTVACIAVAVVTGRLRDRMNAMRNVGQTYRSEMVDADERLTKVLEAVTDGFVTVDDDWRLTYVNRRAERIFGRSRHALIGRSGLDIFAEGVGTRIHRELERARTEHKHVEFESYYAPGKRWFEMRAYPAEEGGLTIYFRDITSRKNAAESLALQARLLNAVGQAVIAINTDGMVFYCNDAAANLFGWPAAQLIGRSVRALHDDPRAADAVLERATSGQTWSGDATLRRRDGTSFPAHVSDSPIADHDGVIIGIVRVANDSSARIAEQQSQQILAEAGAALTSTLDYEHTLTILNELVVPALADCCIVDVAEPDGIARRVEIAWAPAQGQTTPQRTTRRVEMGAASGAALLERNEPLLINRINEEVLREVTSDGSELNRLRGAGVRSMIVVPMNIRDRQLGTLCAIAVHRTYDVGDVDLLAELARRAAFAIDNAMLYEAASMANQSKSDFLAVMSHELRTPLTTVMGYTDLLLAGVTAQLPRQTQTYVERIRTAAWHLLGLIEQILIYARLEVGRERVHVEKVVLARVLRDAAELIEPVAHEKGLRFVLHEPAQDTFVETDATKLRQILLNLLSNAVKFTDQGSVELEARVTDRHVEFMVQDTGVGIAPEHQQRVFDSFWQVDQSATRKEGGTGIGLSVSRKLARLLGGDIVVRSAIREGTTFTLILPRGGLTSTGQIA